MIEAQKVEHKFLYIFKKTIQLSTATTTKRSKQAM
jgi:hypothetical protein